MQRRTLRQSIAATALMSVVVTGCGEADDGTGLEPGGAADPETSTPDPEEPVTEPDENADHDEDLGAGAFDAATALAEAEALLGTTEDDLQEGEDLRVIRRGDEEFLVTADHRPGRQNVELDEDGSGTFVVVRVMVEVPDGEDPIDVS